MACVVWADEFKRNLSFNYFAAFENVCVSLSFRQRELKLSDKEISDSRRYDTNCLQVHSAAGFASLNVLLINPCQKLYLRLA